MSNAILQTRDLRFSYAAVEGDSPSVLNGVDLTIEEGSFVAVLGHNGSGKSTLAKHLNAILLPTGGAVDAAGMDTADESLLLGHPPHRRHGLSEPGQPDRSQRGGGRTSPAPENLGVPPEEILSTE